MKPWMSPIVSLLLLTAIGCLPTMKKVPSNNQNITGSVSIPAVWGTEFQGLLFGSMTT